MAQYNYILVVGEKEVGTGQVSIYFRIYTVIFKACYEIRSGALIKMVTCP